MRRLLLLLLLLHAIGVAAQDTNPDARILSLPAKSNAALVVRTAPDMVQTFLFAPRTRIIDVKLSDPSAFHVVISGARDSLTLRGAKLGSAAMMTVHTSMQTYEFSLTASQGDEAPRVIQLLATNQGRPLPTQSTSRSPDTGAYKLTGDRALRPTSIRDDGRKTFIEWSSDQAMPATFAVTPTGEEQMIDGYMRGSFYTLDRVYEKLIFRIDRKAAGARRVRGR